MTESEILYQQGDYWICRASAGYEVYKNSGTHSVRCAVIGYPGDAGLERAKMEVNRRNAGLFGRELAMPKYDYQSIQSGSFVSRETKAIEEKK